MTDFGPLRDQLHGLRRRTLVVLAERSKDAITDTGLIGLVGDIQTTLAVFNEEARGRNG